MPSQFPAAVIEDLQPLIDGGRYPIKRVVGEDVVVEADVFKDGHDIVAASLKWRLVGQTTWHETAMKPLGNDRWRGIFSVYENATYEYTVEAWTDVFAGWKHEYAAKFEAGLADLTSETLEGVALLAATAKRTRGPDAKRLREFAEKMRNGSNPEVNRVAQLGELEVLMKTYAARYGATQYSPAPQVIVDRTAARTAAWYEFFPRSAEGKGDRGSTFRECLRRIDDAKAMGFDVIYFPPIHPIGLTNRKGRNNSVASQPGEPGVPYAIGNRHLGCPNGGGHKDVEPSLGTLEDFAWLESKFTSGEWRSRSTSQSIVPPIIPMSSSIPNGSTNAPTAR